MCDYNLSAYFPSLAPWFFLKPLPPLPFGTFPRHPPNTACPSPAAPGSAPPPAARGSPRSARRRRRSAARGSWASTHERETRSRASRPRNAIGARRLVRGVGSNGNPDETRRKSTRKLELLWVDEILHHFETTGICGLLEYCRGRSGFFGGAKWTFRRQPRARLQRNLRTARAYRLHS